MPNSFGQINERIRKYEYLLKHNKFRERLSAYYKTIFFNIKMAIHLELFELNFI